jgi:hypothetical protein
MLWITKSFKRNSSTSIFNGAYYYILFLRVIIESIKIFMDLLKFIIYLY